MASLYSSVHLICLTRISVCKVNHSAMCKSLFVNDMLHDYVVLVSINADAFRLCEGPR